MTLPMTVSSTGLSARGEASFGTYEIDERAHSFTYHVEGALVRTLIGKDLTRVYDFSGKQLIVKSSSSDEHCCLGAILGRIRRSLHA
jgi:Lipocalin-like domain